MIDKKIFMFTIKEVHFSDKPYDVQGCDFVIFPFCKNKVETKGFFCYKKMTSIIDLTQHLDSIWEKMEKSSVRYGIKRAEREGIQIKMNHEYDQFFQIYRRFLRKKGLNSFFEDFGLGIVPLHTMKKNGTLLTAEYNGRMLGGLLFLEDESHIETWVSASTRFECEKDEEVLIGNANRLIWWEAIKYAKEKGLEEFDFGGLFPEDKTDKDVTKKGINAFKLSFGGDIVSGYSYEKGYSKLLKVAYYLFHLKNKNAPV